MLNSLFYHCLIGNSSDKACSLHNLMSFTDIPKKTALEQIERCRKYVISFSDLYLSNNHFYVDTKIHVLARLKIVKIDDNGDRNEYRKVNE